MSPDFDSEAEVAILRNIDFRGRGNNVFDGFCGDGESIEVECVQNHVSEANYDGNDDSQGYCSSCESFVLMVLLVAEQLSGVKEVCGHNQSFQIF